MDNLIQRHHLCVDNFDNSQLFVDNHCSDATVYAYSCVALFANVGQGWLHQQTAFSGLDLHISIDHDNLLQLIQKSRLELPQLCIVAAKLQRQG